MLLDEVYVKPTLTYQGGSVFGKSVNYPDRLATTVLSYMVKPLFGRPKFLDKVLPVANLDCDFLFSQTSFIMEDMR